MTTVKAVAKKGDRVTVSARLILERCSSNDSERIGTDDDVRRRVKKQFGELFGEQWLSEQPPTAATTNA